MRKHKRKTRTKEQEKALLRQAAEIRAEYDYLDTIQPFVWVWEFVRRSERYRSGYARIQSAISKASKEIELLTLLDDFRVQALEDGIITFSHQTKGWSIHSGYLAVKMPRELSEQSCLAQIFGSDNIDHSVYLPDPERRYIDLSPQRDDLGRKNKAHKRWEANPIGLGRHGRMDRTQQN